MRGASLKLGSVEVKGVVASAATQAKGAFAGDDYQGNIGGGVLKRFVVTFDYAHQIMYLKPLTGQVADAGVFDRSGMWINRAQGGYKVVDVTASGPAQAAGVKVGDLITAIEGKRTTALAVYDARRRLRTAAPGTVIPIAVTRDGKTLRLKITLRDLI
jgi:S1-C subfamily serine protease